MLSRVLFAGIAAGLLAGALAFVVLAAEVTPLILEAEVYEAGASDAGAGASDAGAGASAASHPGAAAPTAGQASIRRTALTAAASLVVGAGFGLVLAGAIALSGRAVGPVEGLVWGMGGYAAFALGPALALPPALPGTAEGDLAARQLLWIATAAATVAGLALAALAKAPILRGLGLVLVVVPHLYTAPPTGKAGAGLPDALVAAQVSGALAVAAVFWASLGLGVGFLMRRGARASTAR